MLYLNRTELERKYGPLVINKDRLEIHLNPNNWGRNIHKEENIWRVEQTFLAKIKEDLLFALSLQKGSKEDEKIRMRTVINNHEIIVEFILPEEIKG